MQVIEQSVQFAPMTIAEMKTYNLTSATAINNIEGLGELSEPRELLASWQYVAHRQLWRGLQGFYGRNVNTLTQDGLIERA